MKYGKLFALLFAIVFVMFSNSVLYAQQKDQATKIKDAVSAAPPAISKDATVMDWPSGQSSEMPVLRQGSNDWTCLPDDPKTPADDPMCMDKGAMQWAKAWMSHSEPQLTSPGLGYMLKGGGSPSNTDPYAEKPVQGQTWLKEPPHLMVFPAGKLDPSLYTTDPKAGRPWIMFAGTPYEHLMIPVK